MEVRLYSNFVKKVNSTKLPSGLTPVTVEVVLKQATNQLNPVFILTRNYSQHNYVYVPDWGRYYYVNDVVYGNNDLCELHCSLDVLASFRSDILRYDGFIERTSHPSYFNPDIRDSALSVEDKVEYTAEAITDSPLASDVLYIVRIVGRGTTGGIGTFIMNRATFQRIFSALWGDIDTGSALGNTLEFMQLYISNPAEYIVGVYTTPIGMSYYADFTSVEKVYLGGHETTLELDRLNGGVVTLREVTLNKPTIHYTDFRRTDGAFSQYNLYIPTVGNVPLSPDIIDCELKMTISADLVSGDLFFVLKADGSTVATYNSNCYSSVAMGSLNMASSSFMGATQVMTSAMTGNPIGVIEGIKTGFNSTPSVIGTQGGTGCVSQASDFVLSVLQKSSGHFATTVYGRPCCKFMNLNNLLGHYVKCGNASVSIAGFEADKTAVNSQLNNGIYLE